MTEHGYPGTARYQFEPGFRGGERSQAAYLARSLPLLRRAGAAQVFVTLRDSWQTEFTGKYTTEGVVHLAQNSPFAARRKPAFKEVAELNARWRQAVRWRALRKKHLRAKARFERAARKPGISRRAARRYGRLARHHARMARRYTKKRSR